MQTKNLGLIISAFVLSLSFAPAANACENGGEPPDCEEPPPPPPPPPVEDPPKGNNGWGNGSDEDADGNGGTNNGSFTGGTVGSKSINRYGTGPGPTKHTER